MISSCSKLVVLAFLLPLSTFGSRPCPILGPPYLIPASLATSSIVHAGTNDLTRAFDALISTGNSSHGAVTSNTTSFSIALFSPSNFNVSSFYEYHHTAPWATNANPKSAKKDSRSVYRLGDLTRLLTVYSFLHQTGDRLWLDPVTDYVPELRTVQDRIRNPILEVDWNEITLGDLASHMSGIGRDIGSTNVLSGTIDQQISNNESFISEEDQKVMDRKAFFARFAERSPVSLPSTTPAYSNAAFQILGYALESILDRHLEEILQSSVLGPLGMRDTTLLPSAIVSGTIKSNLSASSSSSTLEELSFANGASSSIRDLSNFGSAILASSQLPRSVTRRWLKPVAHTSNPANTIGRPWIIYNGGGDTVVEIFTLFGNIGLHSSYLGLVPNYNIGFAILAEDAERSVDLNAYADIIGDVLLPSIVKAVVSEAAINHAGTYNASSGSLVKISARDQYGLAVSELIVNGTNIMDAIAAANNIASAALSIRLYPTDLQHSTGNLTETAFRAVFQDDSALADGGTATCISWMGLDASDFGGKALDLFVFGLDPRGRAISIDIPALEVQLVRAVSL